MCISGCGGASSPVIQQSMLQQAPSGGGGAAASAPSTAMLASQAVAGSATLGGSATVHAHDTAHSHTITHSNGTTKTMFTRQVPEDRAKAAGVVQQLMAVTAKYADPNVARAAGFSFMAPEGTLIHAKNPNAGSGVNLNEPNMLLYRQTGGTMKLVGAVLMARDTAPDLGMGEWHVHDGHRELMKHVWFTPGDLNTAFSESGPKA